MMTGAASEYQYHLKDHLGNVRMTFTTKEEIEDVEATMETASVTSEHSQFLNYDEAVKVNSTLFDHTDNGTTHYSTRLRGSTNEQYGLAKSLSVMPGDTIRIEVFAKYIDPNSANWQQVLSDLMTAIANGTAPAGTVVDGGLAGSIGNATFPYEGVLTKASGGTPPKAFVNYIMFDRDVNPILDPEQTNFIQVSELAREDGTNGDHEHLNVQVIAKQAGLMYIYLSNDNVELGGSAVEVFFDDFRVEHVKSPVIQTDDYYPFGLTFNSYQRENALGQKYLFNSKEVQDELQLGWYDYQARQYDPGTGRFLSIDPAADLMRRFSPYAYAFDNPIRFIDPDGMIPEDATDPEKKNQQQQQTVQQAWDNASPAAKVVTFLALLMDKLGGAVNQINGNESDNLNSNIQTAANTVNDVVMTVQGTNEILTSGPASGKNLTDDAANTAKTVASKTDDVASLATRATEIHSAVAPATQRRTTIAVGQAMNSEGQSVRIVGSSEVRLRPAQRNALQAGEIEARGQGHAEVTVMNYAKNNGYSVSSIAASRPICQNCATAMQSSNVAAASALKQSYIPYHLRK